MKKLTTLLALIALLFALSCQKQPADHYPNPFLPVTPDSNQVLIQAARLFMTQHEPAAPPMTDSLPYARTSLHKTPVWDQAQVQTFSFGKGVVVPVNIQEPLSIRVGPDQVPLSDSRITWLLLYQDPGGQWHPEVITRLPNDTAAGLFQGKVRVEDWQGHFLKAFLYLSDTTLPLASSDIYQRATGALGYTKAPNEFALECSTTDWYACSSIGDDFMGCDYAYTEEDCVITPGGGGGESIGGGGAPTGSDYGSVGGGGGGSSSSSAVSQIKPSTAITNNPIVACVWNHLMSSLLTNGLKSILSSFGDNTIYNVSFTLGTVSGDGMCSYQGNNNFLVTINAGEADDPNYSRIYLASTFIHEAFHAKLRQKALETFGEAAISQWPTSIDDMTLSELASYFEAESKSENIWESVEHDWMVNNITDMATSLQEFVQTFYQSTYAQVGSSLAPYIALMYMGLQTSTIYQEAVVDQGQETTVENYWRDLNEGGKCSD